MSAGNANFARGQLWMCPNKFDTSASYPCTRLHDLSPDTITGLELVDNKLYYLRAYSREIWAYDLQTQTQSLFHSISCPYCIVNASRPQFDIPIRLRYLNDGLFYVLQYWHVTGFNSSKSGMVYRINSSGALVDTLMDVSSTTWGMLDFLWLPTNATAPYSARQNAVASSPAAPTQPPTEPPLAAPSSSPMAAPLNAPALPPADAPVYSPVAPISSPAVAPAFAPIASPFAAPAFLAIPSFSLSPVGNPLATGAPISVPPVGLNSPSSPPPASSESPRLAPAAANNFADSVPSADGSAPIGAIIGGVVAFAVVLGIVLFVVFFVLRKKKKNKKSEKKPPTPETGAGVGAPPLSPAPAGSAPMENTMYGAVRSLESASAGAATPRRPTLVGAKWNIEKADLDIGEMIGSGNYGTVFEGDWRGAPVAIKQCSDELNRDEFYVEAATMAQIRPRMAFFVCLLSKSDQSRSRSRVDKNVCQIYGVHREGAELFLVMENIPGGNLLELLNEGELKMDAKMKIIADIVSGMLHLHSEGIIHRDLAARNVLLTEDNIGKISDFGMSRPGSDSATSIKTLSGPIRWMSPESIASHSYSTKSDVYSFGVLLWEIVTNGETPLINMTTSQVAIARRDRNLTPEIPEDAPLLLADLIKRCWATDPSERPTFKSMAKTFASYRAPRKTRQSKAIPKATAPKADANYSAFESQDLPSDSANVRTGSKRSKNSEGRTGSGRSRKGSTTSDSRSSGKAAEMVPVTDFLRQKHSEAGHRKRPTPPGVTVVSRDDALTIIGEEDEEFRASTPSSRTADSTSSRSKSPSKRAGGSSRATESGRDGRSQPPMKRRAGDSSQAGSSLNAAPVRTKGSGRSKNSNAPREGSSPLRFRISDATPPKASDTLS